MRDEPNVGIRCSTARSSDTIKGYFLLFLCFSSPALSALSGHHAVYAVLFQGFHWLAVYAHWCLRGRAGVVTRSAKDVVVLSDFYN